MLSRRRQTRSRGAALALLLVAGTASAQDPAPSRSAPAKSSPEAPPAATATIAELGGVDEAVAHAHTLMLQDRLNEALGLLKAALNANPERAEAWHWLGMVQLRLRHPADGIAALEHAMQLTPLDPSLRFDLASAYEGENRPADAERIYQAMLGDDAVGIEARFRLGRLYSLTGRLDSAIESFEKVQAAKDRAPELASTATAQLDGLYTRKTQALIDAMGKGEADGYSRAIPFGIAMLTKRKSEMARKIFEAAIKASPQQPQAYYWLARLQITGGHMEEGLKNLEQSSTLAPANLRLKLELGKAYDAAKHQDDAARVFKDVIDHGKEPALLKQARRLYGLLRAGRLFKERNWAAALAIFESLLQDTPDDPRILELKAQALEELGRHSEADPIFDALLKRFPKDAVLRSRLAGVYERRGDAARAKEQYARILQLQPTGEQARLALDRLGLNRASELLQKNQPVEALKIFESVLAIDPEVPAANLGAGIAYHRLKLNAEAEAAIFGQSWMIRRWSATACGSCDCSRAPSPTFPAPGS